ncbi:DEKNAAC101694 [Brettanomyces naardenensis]|uniref:3'(2'),5'-bisphosphate nucleotidase n=1 Tax=Brettanomyces naardenensis TaxID=13370 RepID=A0A448YIQ3_BRENA|nr:DEKNAAC101694 [Brettanomyces naardenensis]
MSKDIPYLREIYIAQLAVKRASLLTKKIADEHLQRGISKVDKSPVTVGDFGAQAVVINSILKNFPGDEIVGEEDSRLIKSQHLETSILKEISWVQEKDSKANEQLGKIETAEQLCDAVDKGNSEGGRSGRIWALDPIDGTKGFIRGDQYAVCLALIVDGVVQVGVIGCPNLPHDLREKDSKIGGIYTAIRGHGSYFQDLSDDVTYPFNSKNRMKLHNEYDISQSRVVEGVEKGHSSHELQALIKTKLGITQPSVNLDSQVKYCAVAHGDAEIYLRLPINVNYREKIWDHASGWLLVHESGGKVTDMYGNDLDFGHGRTLDSQGVIAATSTVHPKIIKVIKEIVGEHGEELQKYCG